MPEGFKARKVYQRARATGKAATAPVAGKMPDDPEGVGRGPRPRGSAKSLC